MNLNIDRLTGMRVKIQERSREDTYVATVVGGYLDEESLPVLLVVLDSNSMLVRAHLEGCCITVMT